METTFQALLIVVSVILTIVVLMQSRGAGFGGAFGSQGSAYRTRRGIERYLFRGTVILAAVFVVVALITARIHSVQ
jgi:preprotein translocase subunit SecG